jgi:hypothetical protein
MPGPDRKSNPAKGIAREIYIYKPITVNQTKKQSNGFYSEISTPLVAKVTSNEAGIFKVALPAGEYSIFVKEPEGLFANLIDGQGRINVVSVEKHQFLDITIKVNYKAAY